MTQEPPGAHEPLVPSEPERPHDELESRRDSGRLMALIIATVLVGLVVWWLFFSEPADPVDGTAPTNVTTTIAVPG
jgi:hypothetical protein